MNIIRNSGSSFLPRDITAICISSLESARAKCVRLDPSISKNALSDSMIVGTCNRASDITVIAKTLLDDIYYKFEEAFGSDYGINVFLERLQPEDSYKFNVTNATGNFATLKKLRGGVSYKGYSVDVVLIYGEYNLFRQCFYTLDIIIEQED